MRLPDPYVEDFAGCQQNFDALAPAVTGEVVCPEVTAATLPDAAASRGRIVFVSDGGAGAVFRGSNGTTWVSLG